MSHQLKQGKGLMHYIRESNKPRDSKGRYCKPKQLTAEDILKLFSAPIKIQEPYYWVGIDLYNKLNE